MIATLAALMLNGVTVPMADLAASQLPLLFEQACLDGEAKLPPGAAGKTALDALPRELRQRLGTPESAEVWRLNTQGKAYLYVLNYPPASNGNTRVCGIASDSMNSRSAADAVALRVTGRSNSEYEPSMQWLSPEAGYRAVVTRSGKFNIAQVNWLSESERAAALRAYRQLAH